MHTDLIVLNFERKMHYREHERLFEFTVFGIFAFPYNLTAFVWSLNVNKEVNKKRYNQYFF